jgi:hypothetical protein
VFWRVSSIAAVLLVACASTTDEAASNESAVHAGVGSTDPMDHLTIIASPQANGRGTPSPGLQYALNYVVAECKKAQLQGGLGLDAYEQPWTMSTGAQTSNVLALRPGSGPHAASWVLMSAHLDHLGAGYPGADDNGSGSAALLAIANRLAGKKLDRGVAFLWTTGEEKGLLGSKYFVDHPLASFPLDAVAQEINLDAVGALEDTRFSFLSDDTPRTKAATELMKQANAEMDRPFARINEDLDAYATRTDGYSFVRHRVPTVWVFEGLTNPNGGGSLMPRYHQPTDTIDNLLADNGGSKLRRMTEMLARTVEKVANASFE